MARQLHVPALKKYVLSSIVVIIQAPVVYSNISGYSDNVNSK